MHPDLFITIAFVSVVLAFALVALAAARHERRRDHAEAARKTAELAADGERSSTAAEPSVGYRATPRSLGAAAGSRIGSRPDGG